MTEVMSDYPNYSGIAYYIEGDGTAHLNRVGGLGDLIRYQPVSGQPGVSTDG